MSTSGLNAYLTPQNLLILDEALELVGTLPALEVDQKIRAFTRSCNFLFTSWLNRGLTLFRIETMILALNTGQAAYDLPANTDQVLLVNRRTSTRNLNGVAFSSAGGVANNAFDGNPLTACIQTVPNGYISYNWTPSGFAISMVGVQSNVNANYTLSFEYSQDNITWSLALAVPTQAYVAGQNVWFAIPVPTTGLLFRVRETGGATLNIQELYFNNNINDSVMTPFSNAEYNQQPNKTQPGTPSSFWFSRKISPKIYLFQAPNSSFNALFIERSVAIQDFGSLTNTPDIPNRFLQALILGVAHRLSIKYEKPLDRVAYIEKLYETELRNALSEDYENVPLRIYQSMQNGYAQL